MKLHKLQQRKYWQSSKFILLLSTVLQRLPKNEGFYILIFLLQLTIHPTHSEITFSLRKI